MRALTSTHVRHATTGTATAAVVPIVASAPQHRHRRRAQHTRARCAAAPSTSGGGGRVYSINTDASTVAPPQQLSATTTSPLEPYIIVDRREILRARWDVREHSADEAARARARLEAAGAESVEFGIVPGLAHAGAGSGGGGSSVALTATCAADGGGLREALAAIILEETPALEVRFAVESRASLPVRTLSVPTPWGAVSVRVSLRGSEPHKASPHWPSCEQVAAAAAAAAGGADAATSTSSSSTTTTSTTTSTSSSSATPGATSLVTRPGRRFYMLGGKGGVGKTSCSAALALRFAGQGHKTLIVSTDPAHSLSDSFDQDLSGGAPVRVASPVAGPDDGPPLWGMQIDLEQSRQELRAAVDAGGGQGLNDFLDNLGLGMIANQLKDLSLGDLLNTPPPGVDEAIAIAKVVQLLQSPKYAQFDRVVFDTAPTGHTLRLLTLPDFLDKGLGKLVRLRAKLSGAAGAVKSLFTGKAQAEDPAVAKMNDLRDRMEAARALFHDASCMRFAVVTIPTAMAAAESARLAASLRQEGIPVTTMVVNQVVAPEATEKFLQRRRADQRRALDLLRHDPELARLQVIEAPLLDLEVRGAPALQYFGGIVWHD